MVVTSEAVGNIFRSSRAKLWNFIFEIKIQQLILAALKYFPKYRVLIPELLFPKYLFIPKHFPRLLWKIFPTAPFPLTPFHSHFDLFVCYYISISSFLSVFFCCYFYRNDMLFIEMIWQATKFSDFQSVGTPVCFTKLS